MSAKFTRKFTCGNMYNLIRYHYEENDRAFRDEARLIAMIFEEQGKTLISDQIYQLMARPMESPSLWDINPDLEDTQVSTAQQTSFAMSPYTAHVQHSSLRPLSNLEYLQVLPEAEDQPPLELPRKIQQDLRGLLNALMRDVGMCKFLFQGPPGTGKTESVRFLAHQLRRPLYYVDFATIVDSKLGQTSKNLVALFQEIARVAEQQQAIVIFDEIDALALDRVGSDDLREMGRVTSILLRELDRVSKQVVIIATTNLFEHFDKALVRRFDTVVDFSRYSRDDLAQAAQTLYNYYLTSFKGLARHTRLFKKIIAALPTIPYPGELKNLIRTSMAFSDLDSDTNYLARLYQATHPESSLDLPQLKQEGFSLREIEILTGISKSQVARNLQE